MAKMPKELIKDPKTGKLREPSKEEFDSTEKIAADREKKRLKNLADQRNADYLTMDPDAYNKKWRRTK